MFQYLITNFNDFQLACIGSFFLHESVFFLSGLPFILLERAGWLSKYKIQVSLFYSIKWITRIYHLSSLNILNLSRCQFCAVCTKAFLFFLLISITLFSLTFYFCPPFQISYSIKMLRAGQILNKKEISLKLLHI